MTQPILAVVRIADAVTIETGRIGSATGVQNMHSAGRSFHSAESEIEPLVKIRFTVGADIQLNIAGIVAANYLDIACIKVLAYMHILPLSIIWVFWLCLSHLAVVSLLVFVIIADPFF